MILQVFRGIVIRVLAVSNQPSAVRGIVIKVLAIQQLEGWLSVEWLSIFSHQFSVNWNRDDTNFRGRDSEISLTRKIGEPNGNNLLLANYRCMCYY